MILLLICAYSLGGSKAYAAARRLRSGTVGHKAMRTDVSVAFGGFKQSGPGREGGLEGLHPFLEAKTLVMEGTPAGVPAAETV